ncbi:MAG TPA: BON domain-containing protein [Polyangiales bacterium]|nr:BON domain-containing protein [Polyangiales bacterium]
MSRDYFSRSQSPRDDRERYNADERDLRWNRDYSGYGPRPRDEDPYRYAREGWQARGFGRDDDREYGLQRARGRAGEGFYDAGDEYAHTAFGQADYRADSGYNRDRDRDDRDGWQRSRFGRGWDADRFETGFPRWNDQSRSFGRANEYGQRERFGAQGRFDLGFGSSAGRDFDRGGDRERSTGRFASERDRFQSSQYGRGPRGYKRSDERIREDVNDRLFQDHEIDASEIEVRVSDGHVTLEGSVVSRYIKRQAEDLADSVLGVNDVTNHLRVRREDENANANATAQGTTENNNGQKNRTGATATRS